MEMLNYNCFNNEEMESAISQYKELEKAYKRLQKEKLVLVNKLEVKEREIYQLRDELVNKKTNIIEIQSGLSIDEGLDQYVEWLNSESDELLNAYVEFYK